MEGQGASMAVVTGRNTSDNVGPGTWWNMAWSRKPIHVSLECVREMMLRETSRAQSNSRENNEETRGAGHR